VASFPSSFRIPGFANEVRELVLWRGSVKKSEMCDAFWFPASFFQGCLGFSGLTELEK
jgi:hypothetical protein